MQKLVFDLIPVEGQTIYSFPHSLGKDVLVGVQLASSGESVMVNSFAKNDEVEIRFDRPQEETFRVTVIG